MNGFSSYVLESAAGVKFVSVRNGRVAKSVIATDDGMITDDTQFSKDLYSVIEPERLGEFLLSLGYTLADNADNAFFCEIRLCQEVNDNELRDVVDGLDVYDVAYRFYQDGPEYFFLGDNFVYVG